MSIAVVTEHKARIDPCSYMEMGEGGIISEDEKERSSRWYLV